MKFKAISPRRQAGLPQTPIPYQVDGRLPDEWRAGDEIVSGSITYVTCHTINALAERVLLPKVTIEQIMTITQVVELLWPLGIYVGFTVEGVTTGIFGANAEGKVLHGVAQEPMKAIPRTEMDGIGYIEAAPSRFGPAIETMWISHRMTPAFTTLSNYDRLLERTKLAHPKVVFPTP